MIFNQQSIPDDVVINVNLRKSGETLVHQDRLTVPISKLIHQCSKMKQLFDRHTVNQDDKKKETLERLGKSLSDALLPSEIQQKISLSKAEHLILELDARLIQIPWESLTIENISLGERFSVGRTIKTVRHTKEQNAKDWVDRPLKMQIIANPSQDLKEAADEGLALCNDMDSIYHTNLKVITFLDTDVTASDISEKLQHSDILHFAGHSDFKSRHPEECGWRLKEEFFTARDVNKIGYMAKMPSLVVSNACNSAITDQWEWRQENPNNPKSLPAAFICSGVRHYIGTTFKIKDDSGILFSQFFYPALFSGQPIGKALQQTRKEMLQINVPICGSSYILYGPPEMCYVKDNRPYLYYPEHTADQENVITLSIEIESMNDSNQSSILRSFQKIMVQPKWMSGMILIILMLSAALYWMLIQQQSLSYHQTEASYMKQMLEDCRKQYWKIEEEIDKYVMKIHKIRQENPSQNHRPQPFQNDNWTSPPLHIAVTLSDIMACYLDDRTEMMAYGIEEQIEQQLWFRRLGRMKSEHFLQLVKIIYRSQLYANNPPPINIDAPDLLLRVGFETVDGDNYLMMHLLEMTGGIKRFREPLQSGGLIPQSKRLSQNMIKWLNKKYPLQAKIIKVSKPYATLNIGDSHHLCSGQQFKTVQTQSLMAVTVIADYTCKVKLINHMNDIKKGMKVYYVLPSDGKRNCWEK